jgi:thioesterase domain-containing protein
MSREYEIGEDRHRNSTDLSNLQEEPNGSASFDEAASLLLKILGRVLRVKTISLEHRYLDICHDLRRTIIIIREVNKAAGIELPLTLFMEAETIGEIANAVAERSWPPSTGFVRLRNNDQAQPVFVFPGLGGAVMELVDVVRNIDHAGPIYGLPYSGLDGKSPVNCRIEPITAEMLERIRKIQPAGPYLFLAYSAGAYIAIEAARILEQSGEKVDFIGVIEPGVHECHWPLSVWVRFLFNLVKLRRTHALEEKRREKGDKAATGHDTGQGNAIGRFSSGLYDRFQRVLRNGQRVWSRFYHRYSNPMKADYAKTSLYYIGNLPADLQSVRDASIVMLANYRFRGYDGRVHYFRSEGGDQLMCDPKVIWPRFLTNMQFIEVPGDHAAMIALPHAKILAQMISERLPQR